MKSPPMNSTQAWARMCRAQRALRDDLDDRIDGVLGGWADDLSPPTPGINPDLWKDFCDAAAVYRKAKAREAKARASRSTTTAMDIVFDGPPGPEAGRFVEVEFGGRSLRIGKWHKRPDGLWALRFSASDLATAQRLTNRSTS